MLYEYAKDFCIESDNAEADDYCGIAVTLAQEEDKISSYRKNGAKIGNHVVIGKGTIIIAKYLEIGDDTVIGNNSYVKADKFKIGRMVEIGNNVNIVTRKVKIGDVLFTGNNIIIGGGGAYEPFAGIEIGDNCLISSECIINTGMKVTLGNEVGLSPRVQIYTHNHWQNILEGYYPKFGPVTIGDKSYITGGAMITPGINVGAGCTVMANSLVIENIEDYTIVAGVPAKIFKKVNTALSAERKDEILKRLMAELKEFLKYKGFDPEEVVYQQDLDLQKASEKVYLAFNLSGKMDSSVPVIFDLTNYKVTGTQNPLSDEVRNFLRKRGIRFKPILWRYIADKGMYSQ
jgi:acetyltransferase-like isoleucine patch superfamily enzyme